MLTFRTLDVVIGIVFVFLLVSTICAAVREGIEAVLKTRAAYLERGIRELLHDKDGKGLTQTVLNHPLLFGLFMGAYEPKPLTDSLSTLANGGGLPSYIPARSFALALLDIAARGARTDAVSSDPSSVVLSVQAIRDRALNIENPAVRRVLLTALDASRGDLELARKNLEDWFNASMDRVSGWYKRSTQWVIFVIALAVTGAMNIDTIELAGHLYSDGHARAALVDGAEKTSRAGELPKAPDALSALEGSRLPIGWGKDRIPHGLDWLNRLLGWLITAVAATLGAPFWFDVLNKVMVIRSTVKPHEKSPDEFSEDRQPPQSRRNESPAPGSALIVATPLSQPATLHPQRDVLLPRDAESDTDACGVVAGAETPDEELPAATGGVG